MRKISWHEISSHNGPDDCWIVIDGQVFDVTSWVKQHPGGELLAVLAGEDASALFHSAHFLDARLLPGKMKVGEVRDYKPDFKCPSDDFLKTLKHRVRQFFIKQKINYHDTKNNRSTIFFSSTVLLGCWMCVYLLPPWGFLATVPMGMATCSLIGSFGHEHIHGNLHFHNKEKGMLYHATNNLMWGIFIPFMPEKFFQYEHIKHHRYAIHPEHDYDVFALKNFVRLSPDLERKWYHTYQKLYAPFIYGYYIFIQLLGGYTTDFFSNRDILKDKGVLPDIILSSLAAFTFHIAIPIYLTNVWWVLLCATSYFFTWQMAIYITSGVPHMTDSSAASIKTDSWAYYVCSTTKDLKCGNRFYDWLTGGLNYHLEHHLLPSIPRDHLPKIRHIVEHTCREFGYPYHAYESFSAYFRDHYNYLAELGSTVEPANIADQRDCG